MTLAEREVLVDISANANIIDLYACAPVNQRMKALEHALRTYFGVDGPAVRARFRPITAETLDEQIGGSDVRVLVFSGAPPTLATPAEGPLLLGAQIDAARIGWHPGVGALTGIAGMGRSDFTRWLIGLLLDIFIANSSPISPIIKSYSRQHSLSGLYKAKVDFSMRLPSSIIGPVDPNAGYVALSMFPRSGPQSAWDGCPIEQQAETALAYWDAFLTEFCASHFQVLASVSSDITRRSKIGGQLAPPRLTKGLIPGIGLVAVFTPRQRQSRDLASEAAAVFPFKGPRRNSMAFLPANALWSIVANVQFGRRKRLLAESRIVLERYYGKS